MGGGGAAALCLGLQAVATTYVSSEWELACEQEAQVSLLHVRKPHYLSSMGQYLQSSKRLWAMCWTGETVPTSKRIRKLVALSLCCLAGCNSFRGRVIDAATFEHLGASGIEHVKNICGLGGCCLDVLTLQGQESDRGRAGDVEIS